MKRLLCRLFHDFAIFSLLLCMGTAVLWVRSYRVLDRFWRDTAGLTTSIELTRGEVSFGTFTTTRPDAIEPGPLRRHSERPALPPARLLKGSARAPWPLDQSGFVFDQHDWRGLIEVASSTDGLPPKVVPTGWRHRLLAIPCWFLVLATAVLPAVAAAGSLRRRRTREKGLCPACGYDCRATPNRCPECGTIPAAEGTT